MWEREGGYYYPINQRDECIKLCISAFSSLLMEEEGVNIMVVDE